MQEFSLTHSIDCLLVCLGVAQVDAFELLFTSEDDAEAGYGEEISPSDFRYIGYRVVEPEGQAGICDYLLEFSFTTWVSIIYSYT